MIRIFHRGDGWNTRLNFVDDNNLFVGYDYSQDCCEDFGYFIALEVVTKKDSNYIRYREGDIDVLPNYHFDPAFFKEVTTEDRYEDGSFAVFCMVSPEGRPDLYLHLYNYHNGYYSHGFEFGIGEDKDENRIIMEKGYL